MENNLKSCPFCGSEAKIIYLQPEYCKNESERYFVTCLNRNCGIHGRRADTEKGAIENWNKRDN